MLICPSDFIKLVLLGRRYTDRQVIELSAKNQFHHLLSLNISSVRITKAGSYKRNLCTRQNKDNGSPDALSVPRIRIRAGLALHTHGLISDLCIPHSAYTITFVMTVLLLDKLNELECFEDETRKLRIGELLNKQAEIYETLGVTLPFIQKNV